MKKFLFFLAITFVVGAVALSVGNVTFAGTSKLGYSLGTISIPPTPAGLRVQSKTTTSITYAWKKVSGMVSSYRLTVNGRAYFDKGYLTKTITGLTPGTKYTAVVAACNTSGCSANSASLIAYTLPLP